MTNEEANEFMKWTDSKNELRVLASIASDGAILEIRFNDQLKKEWQMISVPLNKAKLGDYEPFPE